jgi:hypothetical protein
MITQLFFLGPLWRLEFDMWQQKDHRTSYSWRFRFIKKILSGEYEQSVAIISTTCASNDKKGMF